MIIFALLIGSYAYLIYIFGLLGLLYPLPIGIFTLLFFGVTGYLLYKNWKSIVMTGKLNRLEKILCLIMAFQAGVTLIGVLGPEIAFDSLWYHLTFPKLYLEYNSIPHIPGSLFYYSEMPKLTELLYIPALLFADERMAKFIHFLFGIGVCILLYHFSRKYLSRIYALLSVLLFSSNLIVGWEAITAYVDLSRTFFELCAFVVFFSWMENKKRINLVASGVLLGLAVSVKVLALSTLPIFSLLIFFQREKGKRWQTLQNLGIFSLFTLLIPSPWFFRSYLTTGNPFYPFLTDVYRLGSEYNFLNPLTFLKDIWWIFTSSPDPISPIYLISIPLILYAVFRLKNKLLLALSLYSLTSLLIWFVLPRVGGGRFILAYLPLYSFLVIYTLTHFTKHNTLSIIRKGIMVLIILYSFVFITYRFLANSKFIPFILGRESKAQFLSRHLNFSFGDFYDTDGYFSKNISSSDRVLLIGFHNLYYVNFPFIDGSYIQKGDTFTHIAVQNGELPQRFVDWELEYSNHLTQVKLYSKGGERWVY